MKTISHKLYSFCLWSVILLSLLLTAGLFLTGFLKTCYSTDMETQLVLTRWDHPLSNLLFLFLLLGLFFFIVKGCEKIPGVTERILLICTFLVTGLLGLSLILFGRTMPAADAMSVYSIAERFALGDMSAIHPTESYLSYYPQQIGLIAFYEPIIRLWKLLPTDLAAYHLIKCIYVGLVWVILFFQYKTVHLLFQSHKVNCLYLLLAGTNLSLIFYSSFVYSEIPSFAAISIGIYSLLLFLQTLFTTPKATLKSCLLGGMSLVTFSLSVLLRKNSLILIIAVVIVILLLWFRQPKLWGLLCYAFLCIVMSLSILPGVQKIYEYRAKDTLKSGVTATSYFAMGMQESSRGNGWYNGFNFYTYQDTGMDSERTNQIAKEAIQERLTYFKEHPSYAAQFYLNKYLSQWADGTYACRQATLATSGGRNPAMISVYQGKASKYLIGWCNIYQNVIYLGAFLFCIHALLQFRKDPHPLGIALFLGLIGVFGGFLFHMLWEANSRYIFLYSLLLLPYSAAGLECIEKRLLQKHTVQ